MEKKFLAEEVAKIYRVPVRCVWEWLRSGRLPSVKVGRRYYITESDMIKMEMKGRRG